MTRRCAESWWHLFLLLGLACQADPPEDGKGVLTLSTSDSAGLRYWKLSRSLNDVAAGQVRAETLSVDLTLGAAENGFGHLIDVTTFPDGRIAVADYMEKTIWLFGPHGERLGSVGREGKGPGEFVDPVAVTTIGDYLVVHQTAGVLFTIFHEDGSVVGTSPPQQFRDADWRAFYFRATHPLPSELEFQSTMEDWTRRIGSYDSRTFVFQIQPNEVNATLKNVPFPYDSPPVYLVRLDITGTVLDTVATTYAPPSILTSVQFGTPTYTQPIFARRPIWASGPGWFATGHGSRPQIEVRFFPGDATLILRWPDVARPLTHEEKSQAAAWYYRQQRYYPGGERREELWNNRSQRERGRAIQRFVDFYAFAEAAPQVTAAFGAGACLWLSGFYPVDYADGTALTWVIVNLEEERSSRVVRVPRVGSRVRHVDRTAIYTSYRDNDGVHFVERHTVPGLRC